MFDTSPLAADRMIERGMPPIAMFMPKKMLHFEMGVTGIPLISKKIRAYMVGFFKSNTMWTCRFLAKSGGYGKQPCNPLILLSLQNRPLQYP